MELSFPEILLILAIALLVMGPKDLIKYSQQMGRMLGKFKSQMNNMKVMLTEEVMQEERKQLEELQKSMNEKIDLLNSKDNPKDNSKDNSKDNPNVNAPVNALENPHG